MISCGDPSLHYICKDSGPKWGHLQRFQPDRSLGAPGRPLPPSAVSSRCSKQRCLEKHKLNCGILLPQLPEFTVLCVLLLAVCLRLLQPPPPRSFHAAPPSFPGCLPPTRHRPCWKSAPALPSAPRPTPPFLKVTTGVEAHLCQASGHTSARPHTPCEAGTAVFARVFTQHVSSVLS